MNFTEVRFYEVEIDTIKRELEDLPDGRLVRRGSYYYQETGASQKGITKDPQKIRQLARKAYLQKRMQHFEYNLALARKQINLYKSTEASTIIDALPSSCQTLPIDYFFHSSAKDWNEEAFVGNPAFPENLLYTTATGIRVRSKSERIIADALDHNGIPYRYEAPCEW